ncbi:hypothetical protein EDC04DRAFT_2039154 [Pisolithus marmoratus]|nr:hypothetical protein EDC04DRAFT_2039154 [Pisolithus marmoratus]
MNHNATPSSPYATNLLQLYAIGRQLRYSHEDGNVSTFGDLDHGSARPTMGLFSIPFHDRTSGQIDSNAVSSSPLPFLQDTHPSGDLTSGNFLLSPEQFQTEMAALAQFLSSPTTQPINQTHLRTPFPYTCPTPSQPNSTSYSTADSYTSHYPSVQIQIPNQILSSQPQSSQERLGYPFPAHIPLTRPSNPPGFHRYHARGRTGPGTTDTSDNRTAHILSDHPLSALSDQRVHPFSNHATYLPDDHTAGSIDDYGQFDKSKCNYEQVVDSLPQSSLPPDQLSLTRIEGGNQSQTPTRPPKARSACDRNVCIPCGWRDEDGRKCGMPIRYDDCAGHFAAVHDIENITWDVRIFCRWCSSKTQRKVLRKNLLRHLREVHMRYPRSEKEI